MKKVIGKELVLTDKALRKMFGQFFNDKNVLLQDIWHEPGVGIHIKVGKIGESANLVSQGFEQITDLSKYPEAEEIDEHIEQLFQCETILQKEW